MAINGIGPKAPQVGSYSNIADQLIEAGRAPIKAAEQRKDRSVKEKNEYTQLSSMLDSLGKSVGGLTTPSGFAKLKAESSNPEILQAAVSGIATPGSYEFEVGHLASAQKFVELGFSDLDKTPIGFGYMGIEDSLGKVTDITVNPGDTLKDVAEKINSSGGDVHASIINTGISDEPYKLLVASLKTGEAAKFNIDPDTTFLNFDQIKKAQNLAMKMDDVDVSRPDNKISDLVDGLKFDIKKAAPGTKVQVNVEHDIDETSKGIKEFTDKYNQILGYAHQQTQKGADGKMGILGGQSSLRSTVRTLQNEVTKIGSLGGNFRSLADLGITTNAKTGELNVNEAKLKEALNKDYDGVTKIFADTPTSDGVASRMSKAIRQLQNPTSGAVGSRKNSLDLSIRDQDRQIERKTQQLETKEAQLRKKFEDLDVKMQNLNNQDNFMMNQLKAAMPNKGQ